MMWGWIVAAAVAGGLIIVESGPTTLPPLSASFTARPIQGSTCVAPCAVYFDAIGKGPLSSTPYITEETTDNSVDRPFHSLLFTWDFGDPGSGTWANDGMSKNSATNAIAGHTYVTPGSYQARLTVKNPSGNTSSVEHTIVVVDPASHFSAGNTFCLATDDLNWTGCPLTCASDDNCIVVGVNEFDEAFESGADCNIDAAGDDCANAGADGRWVLLRRGDTFTMNQDLNESRTGNPGLVQPFGSGAKPILDMNGSFAFGGDGWTWSQIDRADPAALGAIFLGDWTASPNDTLGYHLTYYDFSITDANYCMETTDPWQLGGVGPPFFGQLVALVDVNCTVLDSITETYAYWPGPEYFLWQGGTTNKTGSTLDTVRGRHWQHVVHQHHKYINPGNEHWSLRVEEDSNQTHMGAGYTDAMKQVGYVLLSHNIQELSAGSLYTMRFCPDSGCNCTEGAGSCGTAADNGWVVSMHDIIIEGNLFKYLGAEAGDSRVGAYLWGSDISVRNNVIDFGATLNSGFNTNQGWSFGGDTNVGTGFVGNTNCDAFNNTLFVDEAFSREVTHVLSGSIGGGSSGCSTGSHRYNNLTVTLGGSPTEGSDGGMEDANNLVRANATDPFSGTMPTIASRSFSDYIPISSETTIVGAGRDFNSATDTSFWNYLDAIRLCRPANSDGWDIGALEYGASACP